MFNDCILHANLLCLRRIIIAELVLIVSDLLKIDQISTQHQGHVGGFREESTIGSHDV